MSVVCNSMVKVTEISTNNMKKFLGAVRVRQTYHNKHVDGSGNFGIVIVMPSNRWYRIDGNYDRDKELTSFNPNSYGSWTQEDEPTLTKIRAMISKEKFVKKK